MKLRLLLFLFVLFIALNSSRQAIAAEQVFSFEMTQMSLVSAAMPLGEDINDKFTVHVRIQDNGTTFIGVTTGGKTYTTAKYSGQWTLKQGESLTIENSESSIIINRKTSSPGIVQNIEGTFTMYRKPASVSAFNSTFDRLYQFLSSGGKATGQNSHTSKSSGTTARKLSTPAKSGDLLPEVFVEHPFGFLPSDVRTQSEIVTLLNNAGWPAKPYNEESLIIISSSLFTIPYKLYGKDVSEMSCYITPGWMSYSVDVFDFKTKWSIAEANDFAKRIKETLVKEGYTGTEEYDQIRSFYKCSLKKGNRTAEIEVSDASWREKGDSYKIKFRVFIK